MKKKHIIFMIGIMVSLAACGKNTNEMNKSQELDKYQITDEVYESESTEMYTEKADEIISEIEVINEEETINEMISDANQEVNNESCEMLVVFSDKTSNILPVGMNNLGETFIDFSEFPQLEENIKTISKYSIVDDTYEIIDIQRADREVYSYLKKNIKFEDSERKYLNFECSNYDVNTGKILTLDNIVADKEKLQVVLAEQIKLYYSEDEFSVSTDVIAAGLCDENRCKWNLGYQGLTFYIDSSFTKSKDSAYMPVIVPFGDYSDLYEKKYVQVPERYSIDVDVHNTFIYDVTNDNKPDKINVEYEATSYGSIQSLSIKVNDIFKDIEISNLGEELNANDIKCNIVQTDEGKKILYISTSYMLDGLDYGVAIEVTDTGINILNQDAGLNIGASVVTDPSYIVCKGYSSLLGNIWDFATATCWKIQSDGQVIKNTQEEHFIKNDLKVEICQDISVDKLNQNDNSIIEKNLNLKVGTILTPVRTDNATYVDFVDENGDMYRIDFELIYSEDYGYIGSINGLNVDEYMKVVMGTEL